MNRDPQPGLRRKRHLRHRIIPTKRFRRLTVRARSRSASGGVSSELPVPSASASARPMRRSVSSEWSDSARFALWITVSGSSSLSYGKSASVSVTHLTRQRGARRHGYGTPQNLQQLSACLTLWRQLSIIPNLAAAQIALRLLWSKNFAH
eukprot:4436833-Pleurochrysis_carterae.AAC.2